MSHASAPSADPRRPARGAPWALGAALALLCTLGLGLHARREALARYDRHTQPGFDARVYVAMAEDPAFFTLAPWGYRLLLPWLVHALGREPGLDAFLGLSLGALFAGGLLLHVWLVRLGHSPPRALLGALLFGLSPPVGQALDAPFLAEPVIFVLLMLFVLLLEARAGLPALALVATLGALGKDLFLFFLPALFFARRAERGTRRALGEALLASAPALLLTFTLRAWWTPHLAEADSPWPGADVFWLGVWRILEGAPRYALPALLLGATPLALLGALRREARPFLARHGYLLAVAWALPFAASVYTDDTATLPFFSDDIPRLLLYALPTTLHLALLALPGTTRDASRSAARRSPPWRDALFALATLAVLAFPFVALDRYRRVDLRGPRDGPLLLATCRQSLVFARRLAAGRTLAYEIPTRRFRPGKDEPRYLERMRWFLREGWGDKPHYGEGPVLMRARRASVLLPCLRPGELTLTLILHAPAPAALRVTLNGRELQRVAFAGELRLKLRVAPEALFRGDNLLALESPDALPGVELRELRVQPPR